MIDPDGSHPMQVNCDMQAGGYTQVAVYSGGSYTIRYTNVEMWALLRASTTLRHHVKNFDTNQWHSQTWPLSNGAAANGMTLVYGAWQSHDPTEPPHLEGSPLLASSETAHLLMVDLKIGTWSYTRKGPGSGLYGLPSGLQAACACEQIQEGGGYDFKYSVI